jgi:uncharacterized protein YlxP (DUF503 family)
MLVGVAEFKLFLPSVHNLKEKRALIKSLLARLQNKFNAAVCEAAEQDLWPRATVGVAVVGNERRHVESMLDNIGEFVENFSVEIELLDVEREVL